MNLILASASERRQELLKRISDDFKIVVSNFNEEEIDFNGNCGEYVQQLAKGKALEVAKISEGNAIIIGCDTIVSIQGKVLGKPKDSKEAFSMLQTLSGTVHEVYSGIALVNQVTGDILTDYVCTKVKFGELSTGQIMKYIASGDPMDKAGAYGIQGLAGVFVESIQGCYYNVVGLPLNKLNLMLGEMGVNL